MLSVSVFVLLSLCGSTAGTMLDLLDECCRSCGFGRVEQVVSLDICLVLWRDIQY